MTKTQENNRLNTELIGVKCDKIDARREKWINDEKKHCTESVEMHIRMWQAQEDSPLKTEKLDSLRKELSTGLKQRKIFDVK
jgi:hypothetical protein